MLSRQNRFIFRPAPCGSLAATRPFPARRARGSYRVREVASRRRSPRCRGSGLPLPALPEPQALSEPAGWRQGVIPLSARHRLQCLRDRMAAPGSAQRCAGPRSPECPRRARVRPTRRGCPDARTPPLAWRESRPGARFLKELPRCWGRSPPRHHATMEGLWGRQGRNGSCPSMAAHL